MTVVHGGEGVSFAVVTEGTLGTFNGANHAGTKTH
jgi:hypothetical protein